MIREPLRYAVIALAAWFAQPGWAVTEDHQTDVPLSPAEAAGGWTLEAGGRPVCMVTLRVAKAADAGFALDASRCADALPSDAAGWTPTADGMAITASDGRVLVAFERWSNSLFVSHRASGVDLQLQRGGPNPG